MSAIKAKNNYTGKGVNPRMNCAQSVVSAFKDDFNIGDDIIDKFRNYGGGNAPDGLCGALFAVEYIMGRQENNKSIDELEKYFIEQAGALECRNIRGLKKLSCIGCVEKCSEFLEKNN